MSPDAKHIRFFYFMKETKICPTCEREVEATYVSFAKEIEVMGELFVVPFFGYSCDECNEIFDDPDDPCDELDTAYRRYRKKHGRMQPEDYQAAREKLGLTCQEMAKKLGLSSIEYRAIELGALISLELENKIKEFFGAGDKKI